jgi:glycosyltransferase involved in cell wall biosynthesis
VADRLQRKRLMHVVPDLEVGGLQKVVVALCQGIDRSRFDVSALCLWTRGDLAAELEAAGTPVFLIGRAERTDYLAFRKVRSILARGRIDIVHTHNTPALLDGAVGALLAGVRRIIHTEHGRAFPDTRRIMFAERVLSLALHRFVGVSEETVERLIEYEKIPRRKLEMIPNGIVAEPFEREIDRAAKRAELGVPPGAPILGLGARLAPEKGLDQLLEAVRLLRAEFPAIQLLIAGEGPEELVLRALARERGIAESVRFLGVRHDMPELLKVFDVYVLSSLREGLPMSILEAMAAGCPVVATRVGGIHSVIEDGVNGVLVPPRDPRALANAIAALLRDADLRRSFAARSHAVFHSGYSAEQMIRRYEALYLESGR